MLRHACNRLLFTVLMLTSFFFMGGYAYPEDWFSLPTSESAERLAQIFHHTFDSKESVFGKLGKTHTTTDRVTSIHNISNDPEYIYDRITFEYNGAVIRIVWLTGWHVVDFVEVSEPGILAFGAVDIGAGENEVTRSFGPPLHLEEGTFTYLGNSNEKEELDIRVDFVFGNNGRVKRMTFYEAVEVEPLE